MYNTLIVTSCSARKKESKIHSRLPVALDHLYDIIVRVSQLRFIVRIIPAEFRIIVIVRIMIYVPQVLPVLRTRFALCMYFQHFPMATGVLTLDDSPSSRAFSNSPYQITSTTAVAGILFKHRYSCSVRAFAGTSIPNFWYPSTARSTCAAGKRVVSITIMRTETSPRASAQLRAWRSSANVEMKGLGTLPQLV